MCYGSHQVHPMSCGPKCCNGFILSPSASNAARTCLRAFQGNANAIALFRAAMMETPRSFELRCNRCCRYARHLERGHSQRHRVPLILPAPSTPLTPPSWPTIQPALVAAPRTTVYTANSTTRAPAQAVRAARWHIACAPDPLRKPHGDRTFRFERRCSGSRRGYLRQR